MTAVESEVRSYCRGWPTVFTHARGSRLYDEVGRSYLDFFAGAGALNYGHNHPVLKKALISYLESDGITHSLDMTTRAKSDFLSAFGQHILGPRELDYRVQFCGPTGTNSVEAALKLARKVTGRRLVIAFTGAFHGMSLGSLSLTGNAFQRAGAGVTLDNTYRVAYDGFHHSGAGGLTLLAAMLDDKCSGLDLPAAVIVETVQGEGGVNVARKEWLTQLAELCRAHRILLIVDDVQMGCGRTGAFFSFEDAGIVPDLVCLSKSISGYGLPMALTLVRPDLDLWAAGEHNGTFRGNNPAFVTATAAIKEFWQDNLLEKETADKSALVNQRLGELAQRHSAAGVCYRGRGLVWGVEFADPQLATQVAAAAFSRGLLVETSGAAGQLVKLIPPLTIAEDNLVEGLDILADAVEQSLS